MSDSKPLEPGKIYHLDVAMHLTTWVFPKGTSHSTVCFKCPVAHGLVDALQHDYSLQLGGTSGSRLTLPVVPVQGVVARVSPPQAVRRTHGLNRSGSRGRVSGW